MEWNRNLAYCFVHDTSLPIPVINENLFNYYIGLYEKEKDSWTKWNELVELVENRFKGSPESFEEYRKNIRNQIIDTVTATEAYKKFNTMDMKPYAVDNTKYKVSKSVYIEPNIGKLFMSVDLKSANFQSMKYIDKNIMLGAETYEEFMRKFTDIDYFINQKYIRQVIFGQMNPGRHFTIEKYLIYKVMEYIEGMGLEIKPVAIASDEAVYEIHDDDDTTIEKIRSIADVLPNSIKKHIGIDVKIEIFRLNGYGFYNMSRNKKIFTFYEKLISDGNAVKSKLKGVPEQFHSMVWKLMHDKILCENDYHIPYKIEDVTIDCVLNDAFFVNSI